MVLFLEKIRTDSAFELNVRQPVNDSCGQNATFSTITKYDKTVSICYFLAVVAILLQVPGANVLKYTVLPISMILLFKSDVFNYLIFPISFTEDMIGTMFFGKFTLIWFYFPLLFLKLFLFERKKPKIKIHHFLILVLFCIYQIIAFSEYGTNSLKSIFFVFLSVVIAQDWQENEKKYDTFFWLLLLSSIMEAVALAFALSGVLIETSERTTGIGLSDPNYASFIVLLGFCVLLNMSVQTQRGNVFRILGCLLFCLAVFRSGSRSGLIVLSCVLFVRILCLKGFQRKGKYILGLVIVALIVVLLVSTGTIKIPGFDMLVQRLTSTFNNYQSGNIVAATANRSAIAYNYLDYCFSRKLLSILFGGTVVASSDLLAQMVYVTHNVYIDYLLAFGVVGTIFMFGIFIKRGMSQLRIYRETGNSTMLILVEIKACMLVFGATLAFLRVNLWWLLFLL